MATDSKTKTGTKTNIGMDFLRALMPGVPIFSSKDRGYCETVTDRVAQHGGLGGQPHIMPPLCQ